MLAGYYYNSYLVKTAIQHSDYWSNVKFNTALSSTLIKENAKKLVLWSTERTS